MEENLHHENTLLFANENDLQKISIGRLPNVINELTNAMQTSGSPLSPDKMLKCVRLRSQCHVRLHHYQEALDDAKSFLKEDNTDVKTLIIAGQASAGLGKFEESLNYYKTALQLAPKDKMLIEQLKQLQYRIVEYAECSEEKEQSYNTLPFFNQDPYPNDLAQLRREKDILATKFLMPPVSISGQVGKLDESNLRNYMSSLDSNSQSNPCKSMTICNQEIKTLPADLKSRRDLAQLHYETDNLIECLSVLWTIPKANRMTEDWFLGGKILSRLDLPVTAELWLRKATSLDGKGEEAATLFQKVRIKRLYESLSASYPVKIEFTKHGRAVVATKDVKPGDVLLEDISLVHAQTLASRDIPACCHCACSLVTAPIYFGEKWDSLSYRAQELVGRHWPDVTPVLCSKCGREMYCSQQCMQAAWCKDHQVLCPSVNAAASALYDLRDNNGLGLNSQGEQVEIWNGHYSPLVLAKIWAAILCDLFRLLLQTGDHGREPTVEHWAIAKLPYRRFIAFGTTPATDRMPEMLNIFQMVFVTPFHGLTYRITEKEFNGRYYQAACNLQCFSAAINPIHKFLDMRNWTEDDVNGLAILTIIYNESCPEPYFAGMFPYHACLNHACDNNAEVSNSIIDGHFGIKVTAKRNIKKGQEVFITYIDTAMPRMLRRAWLFKSFNFWCQCKRCRHEGDTATSCTQCHVKVGPGKQFPACGKCRKAWYCSKGCQTLAWKNGHMTICTTKHSVVTSPTDLKICQSNSFTTGQRSLKLNGI